MKSMLLMLGLLAAFTVNLATADTGAATKMKINGLSRNDAPILEDKLEKVTGAVMKWWELHKAGFPEYTMRMPSLVWNVTAAADSKHSDSICFNEGQKKVDMGWSGGR